MPNDSQTSLNITFESLNISLLIIDHLSWTTLAALSNAHPMFRSSAHSYIQRRVQYFVRQFLSGPTTTPPSIDTWTTTILNTRRFFKLLEDGNGCIVGGVTRAIMADPNFRRIYERHPPRDMDILFPSQPDRNADHFVRFLKGTGGYIQSMNSGIQYPHHWTASSYIKLYNNVSGVYLCILLCLIIY